MIAANHPITLDLVFFTRTIVTSVHGHVPNDSPPVAATNSLEMQDIEETPGRYQVIMRCVLNEGKDVTYPYSIEMECVGIFTADNTLSKEEAMRGVLITANGVLYGAIRESVLSITSRQAYGQLLLGLSVLPTKPTAEPPPVEN